MADCSKDWSKITDPFVRLRKSLFCAMATATDTDGVLAPGKRACLSIFGFDPDQDLSGVTMCPEDGGVACGMHQSELKKLKGDMRGITESDVDTCEQFCKSRGGRKCAKAELTRGGRKCA